MSFAKPELYDLKYLLNSVVNFRMIKVNRFTAARERYGRHNMGKKKNKQEPKPRTNRKIFFYRAVSRMDKGGKYAFKPIKVFSAIKSLSWKELYKNEGDGKETCCWMSDKIKMPCTVRFGVIRRTDLPQRERHGRLWALNMTPDSGLVEKIHVVFFEGNIIGADYNFYGPSMSKFSEYLQVKGKRLDDKAGLKYKKGSHPKMVVPARLHFEPLLSQDVAKRLDQMKEIRLFRLRIRKSFAQRLSEANRSLAAAFKSAELAGRADNVEIVLRTPPHSKGWLHQKILTAAQKIARIRGLQEEALNFTVKGTTDDEKPAFELDLLGDKLISSQSICLLNDRTKILESRSAFSAIKRAYKKLKKKLENAPSVSHG
jgi:hypothetical protein